MTEQREEVRQVTFHVPVSAYEYRGSWFGRATLLGLSVCARAETKQAAMEQAVRLLQDAAFRR